MDTQRYLHGISYHDIPYHLLSLYIQNISVFHLVIGSQFPQNQNHGVLHNYTYQ